MHISDLVEGTDITITAEKDRKKLEFRTKACFKIDDTLVVEEVQSDESEPISLYTDEVDLSVASVVKNDTPFIWENVVIKHISYMGEEYHRIAQADNGKLINRRNAFRVYIGKRASLQKGINKSTIDVMLKDISTSGFAIITDEELEVSEEQSVHLMCEVKGYLINVYGTVVREQEIPGRTDKIYGCKISRFDKTLDKFIIQYQSFTKNQEMLPSSQKDENDGVVTMKEV